MTPPSKPPDTKKPNTTASRGRPPVITRARIADAGIQIGLPKLTFTGVAAALGVSYMALYKHVPSLEDLRHLVAEEMFTRWKIPRVSEEHAVALKEYLLLFAESVIAFVKNNTGVTPYAIRRLAATPAMLDKIIGHQVHIAEAYQLPMERSRWLLATLAFHCMAVADTVYTVADQSPIENLDRNAEEAEMEVEMFCGIRALISGMLLMLQDNDPALSPTIA